jgi:hypothetical protein
VLRFVDVLVDTLPWGYLLVPEHGGLRLFVTCLARATHESLGVLRVDPVRRVEVADALYREAMTAAFLVGMPDDDVSALRASISAETGVAFDDEQSAGEVFGDVVEDRIAELVADAGLAVPADAGREVETAAPEEPRAQPLRDVWLQGRVDAVVGALGIVGSRLLDEARPDLGRPDLTVAVLATRVESWLSWGMSHGRVLERLADLAVLDGRSDARGLLRRLVETVADRLATGGLGVGEPWRPESGYLLLLEVWAVEQRACLDASTFARQLRQVWGENDERALPYLTALPARPLAEFQELSTLADPDEEPALALMLSQALDQDAVRERRRETMGALHLERVPHLDSIARELADAQNVARALEDFSAFARTSGAATFGGEGQIYGMVAEQGAALCRTTRNSNLNLLSGLSEYEISRLSTGADLRFQDACLDAYVARREWPTGKGRLRGRHGTYGGVPWWCVPASGEISDCVEQVVEEDNAGLGLGPDDGELLALVLATPGGEAFYAFDYELTLPDDVCELMLIGRSRRIGIDFDSELDGKRVRRGTVGVRVADELADKLLEVSTRCARELLGVGDGVVPYASVRGLLDEYFATSRTSWSRSPEHLAETDLGGW